MRRLKCLIFLFACNCIQSSKTERAQVVLEEKMRTGLRATIKSWGKGDQTPSVAQQGVGFSINSPRKLRFSLEKQKINIEVGDEEVQSIRHKKSYKDILYNPENIAGSLQELQMECSL